MLVKGCIIQPNFVLVVSLQDKREESSTDPLLQAEFDKHTNGLVMYLTLHFGKENGVEDLECETNRNQG